ncbi:hypothetical protein GCM10010390_88360 [Streptomyces mordarskii]|uniref:Uncharacterized protein n=1 Tax=Streptomyces mordarskii TaxID=1226758 RepID=A0ABN1EQU2_9ACTN
MSNWEPPVYETYLTRTPVQLLFGVGWKRLLMLRVEHAGVILGGTPKQTAFVPWQDITAVVIWRRYLRDVTTLGQLRLFTPSDEWIDFVGVRRHPGAPPLPGPNSKLRPEQTAKLARHIDHDLFLASRAIRLWRFDLERLRSAVGAFAPHIPVRDERHLR